MISNETKLIKNSLFNVLYRIMNIVFPLITSMYVARILLPEKIGIIAAAQNIAQYFTLFAGMGIPVYGTKVIAQIKRDTNGFNKSFSEIFIINCILSLSSAFIYYNLVIWLPYFQSRRIAYLLTGIPIILNIINVDWFYQGIQEYTYITVRSFVVKCLSLLLLLCLVHSPDDYLVYIIINIIAQGGNYIFNIIKLQKHVQLSVDELVFKDHLKHIVSLFLASIAAEVYVLADVTMLDIMTDSSSVGFYTMGVRIISIFKGLVTAITAVFLPQLSEYYARKEYDQFSNLMNNGLYIILTIAIPVVAGIILCIDDAILIVYGNHYINSISVTRILSVSVLSVALSNYFGLQVLVVLGREKVTTLSTAVGAITNIGLNLLLIRSIGIIGAAIASVVAEICVTLTQIVIAKRYVNIYVEIKNTIIAVFLMSVFVILVRQIKLPTILRFVSEVTIGVLLYSCTLILLKDKFARKIICLIRK